MGLKQCKRFSFIFQDKKVPNNVLFFSWDPPERHNTPLYSGTARYSATTKQQLQMDKPCPAPEQHSVKGLFGQSSTRSEGNGWSWMGLLLTKRESSPPFITLPLLHPFCSPKGWMLQCEKPCVCLVSLEYVIRCDKPPASPQRCLQMQINFPHTLQPQTNSEDKLLARNATTFCSSICWRRRRRMLCFWRKKYLLFVRLLYCWKFCSHQFEVRGRGEMLALAFSESSLQINLRSPAAPPAAHSSYEWEFKGSHFNN